jgi:hypothetical protein
LSGRKEESSSFLKKRSKKLLSIAAAPDWPFWTACWTQLAKVFCFFFSKKKFFSSLPFHVLH